MRLPYIVLALILLLSACVAASANLLVNGDFERSNQPPITGWRVQGTTTIQKTGGNAWQHFQARFNSGDQTEVQVYFEVKQGSTGTLWIDNFQPSRGAKLVNRSLEEVDADGKPIGWTVTGATVSTDTSAKSDGSRSLKIFHKNEAVPTTSLMQRMAVEPNKLYTVDMDIALSDEYGGEGRFLIFSSAGGYSMQENLDDLMVSKLVATRDRCGTALAELRPSQGQPVTLQQQAKTRPNSNLSLSLDILRQGYAGTVKVTASDSASGAVLKEAVLDGKKDVWETITLPLVSQSGAVNVSMAAEGAGVVRLDNVELGQPQVMPDLQHVKWLPSTQNLALPGKIGIAFEGTSKEDLAGATELLAKDLAKLNIEMADSAKPIISVKVGTKYAMKGRGPEAYTLSANSKGVTISAGTKSGAFYGIMTLLQLISSQDGKPYAVACSVTDYPDFPMRGMMYADPEQSARWKCNFLYYSCGYPDTPDTKASMAVTTAEARKLNLDLCPFMQGIHGGYYAQRNNPNLAVGIWQKDEPVTLAGTSVSTLKNAWVIRTGLTDVSLKNADGSTTYKIGKDYTVENGDMVYNYDRPNPKPFGVARTAGSSIPDGATVLVSYDYVSHYRQSSGRTDIHIPYCFEEPQVKELMSSFLTGFVADYQPPYINVIHDLEEFRPAAAMIATDSRTKKTPVQELVDSQNFCYNAIKQGNPNTKVIAWAGTLNSFSGDAAPYFVKDMIINIWGYDATFPNGPGKDAIEFWTGYGHQTVALAWYNLRNVRGWAQTIGKARKKGYACLGLIGSAWSDLPYDISSGGLMETARVSWRVPRKGEKGWVEVPDMADLQK